MHRRIRRSDLSRTATLSVVAIVAALSLAAACATGATTIRGAGELRAKESDRIATVAGCLAALGVPVTERQPLTLKGTMGPNLWLKKMTTLLVGCEGMHPCWISIVKLLVRPA